MRRSPENNPGPKPGDHGREYAVIRKTSSHPPHFESVRRCCGSIDSDRKMMCAEHPLILIEGPLLRRIRGPARPPLVILRNRFATFPTRAKKIREILKIVVFVSGISVTQLASLQAKLGLVSVAGLWSRKVRASIWLPRRMATVGVTGSITRGCRHAGLFGLARAVVLGSLRPAVMK